MTTLGPLRAKISGDGGMTDCYLSGQRVRKDDPMIEFYGCLDELSAHLTLCGVHCPELADDLNSVQAVLYSWEHLDSIITDIQKLEKEIADSGVKFTGFAYGGKTLANAQLHVARTVCRRAERAAVSAKIEETMHWGIQAYLNRLSDWLFAMAYKY